MNFKFSVVALFVSVTTFCGQSNADLLSRMLGRSGCGCEVAASSCCDTPASSCGESTCGIRSRLGSRLGGCGLLSRAGGCGCDGGAAVLAVDTATDCGCDAAPVDTCGTDACGGRRKVFTGQLLSRFGNRGGCDTGCDAAPSCGCEAAPEPAPACGCDAPVDTCGGTRLFNGNLLARLRGNRGCDTGCDAAPACGCEAAPAPAPSCGCDAAPVESCGCNSGRVGILARVRAIGSRRCGCRPQMRDIMARLLTPKAPSCGCDAPVETSCGCDAAPTCGGTRVGLLNRLRSLRPMRGGSCGCDTGCDAAPSCGCDGAASAVIYDSNGQAAPANGPVVPEAAPVAPQAVPVVPATPAPGSVITPGGSTSKINNPVVDPSSFVIRNN